MKMTRRALAGLAAVPAILATRAEAQTPAPAAAPVNAPRNAAGAAGGQFPIAARQLAAVKLPRNVEPVFRFEA
jgi:hypothetical protein